VAPTIPPQDDARQTHLPEDRVVRDREVRVQAEDVGERPLEDAAHAEVHRADECTEPAWRTPANATAPTSQSGPRVKLRSARP